MIVMTSMRYSNNLNVLKRIVPNCDVSAKNFTFCSISEKVQIKKSLRTKEPVIGMKHNAEMFIQFDIILCTAANRTRIFFLSKK